MSLKQIILAVAVGAAGSLASAADLVPADDLFQHNIDSAFQEIMLTHLGQTVCLQILGAQADAIEFHLGVSHTAAASIAQNCTGEAAGPWVYPTSFLDIHKLTVKDFKPRKYVFLSAETVFPIESWTDPFTNTTVLLAGREGISHERLVQLLAHEMAVYFDSKSNPAQADAQNIPQLRNLRPLSKSPMNPLVVISDPLIAHTMTFVRALQVEYAIVEELIQLQKIVPPADHSDPYLELLISDQCLELCLEELVDEMRTRYLPIGLPLVAFSPQFRLTIGKELAHAKPLWHQTQWARVQEALNTLPVEFLKTQFTGNVLADLQKIFVSGERADSSFSTVSNFLNDDLWPIERSCITQTTIPGAGSFLEFMKVPLLSGYNILLSSGPRVRVGTGNVE